MSTLAAPAPTALSAAGGTRGVVDRLVVRARTLPVGRSAAALGALAALIGWLGSWNPSYWGDEAATVLSAERPLPTLFAELGRVDAVHGLYYLGMHFWIGIFGASELSTRLPSVLAVGVLVAGTVVLAARLAEVRFGILAGLVCALLPRTAFLATEARSYAMSAAIAVWIMAFFVGLWRRRETRRRSWVMLGVLIAAAGYLFLYLLLLTAVVGTVLLASERGRPLLRRWMLSLAVTAVAASPIALLAYSERRQIAFLARRHYATAQNVLVDQWFGRPGITVACWTLIVLGIAVFVVRRRAHSAIAVLDRPRSDREVLLLGAAWLTLPTALVLGANAASPMYNTRYLSFCTPAAALLVAFGLVVLARVVGRAIGGRTVGRAGGRVSVAASVAVSSVAVLAIAVVTLGALAVPDYLHDRSAFAKDGGSDLRQTADYLASHARTGDAVVFDETTKPSRRPELAYRLYPQQFAAVTVPEILTPYYRRDGIWDRMVSIGSIRTELASAGSVWAIELPISGETPLDVQDLTADGYRVVATHLVHRLEVYQLQRGSL
jgi:mannosyltransferase